MQRRTEQGISQAASLEVNMQPALSTLAALTLIGLALFLGGLFLRRLPGVGLVLDQIKPDKKRVLNAIKIGGTGSGAMPAGLLQGKEAEAVAEYVSSVA